ncbi:EAL domain-containing protein [Paraburkholderia fungorum]|nr:EAL domain-containing protein [Paraburkholderia fungorum]
MAFGFAVSRIRRSALVALRCASEQGLAVVLVICTCTSLALAGPADTSSSRILTPERNVWKQLTDWLAGPPAPPIRFGSDCAPIAQLPVVPAALAGPDAGPMSVPTNSCDSLEDVRDVAVETAAASASSGPNVVSLLRALQWRIGDRDAAEQDGLPVSDPAAGTTSRAEWTQQTPEPPAPSVPDCSLGTGCETRPNPDSIDADTLAPASPPATTVTQPAPAWNLVGFVLWPVLVAVLVVVAGWALRRWFRYDKSLLRAARAGLRRGEFHLEYQPVVGVRRAQCVGVEALLRWDNEKYGALGPAHFMAFIENSSLIGPMTRFVLTRAAEELREIGAPKSLYLGITAPASYLVSSAFTAHLGEVGSLGLPPLILKIEAASAWKFKKRLVPMMSQARDRGVRFALSAVRPTDVAPELPAEMTFEMVKVDRNVLGMNPDERARQIDALTRMGHEMGAVVVVEGIENSAHHNVARASRAEFGQGFFYSRALGASRLKVFLENANAPSSKPGGAATVLGWRVRYF